MTLRCRTSGERLFLGSATLAPLLKRLESAGLISRQRSRKTNAEVAVTLAMRDVSCSSRPPGSLTRWDAQRNVTSTDTMLALKQQRTFCDISYITRKAILYAYLLPNKSRYLIARINVR